MGVNGLGELDFGSDGAEVIGRLVASLGQPTDDTGVVTSQGELGTCADQRIRVVRYGSLSIVNIVETGGAEVFSAYRVLEDTEGATFATDGLLTISGVRIGDSVAKLKVTYSGLDVNIVQGGGKTSFLLKNSSGSLLLSGPLSSPRGPRIHPGHLFA